LLKEPGALCLDVGSVGTVGLVPTVLVGNAGTTALLKHTGWLEAFALPWSLIFATQRVEVTQKHHMCWL
jgi:hypothetical protein